MVLNFFKRFFSIPEILHFEYTPEEYLEYKFKYIKTSLFTLKFALIIIGGIEALSYSFKSLSNAFF